MPTLTPSSNQKLFAVKSWKRSTAAATVIAASMLRSGNEEGFVVRVWVESGAFTVAEWYLESAASELAPVK
jgi:hypothetical protein